jgi:DNA helicase-2/ATP-dependent DNA helicase PcrA
VNLLVTDTKQNICVVGDDDQSIYAFRGADIRNILDFEKDYPNTRVLRLEQNYRSTQNILDAAWGVVHNNRARKAKKLWTEQESGELVTCYEAMDENDEAGYVGTQIQDWHAEDVDYKDFAVFYRTNAQSRIFEEAFRAANIPYQIVGGVGFYDRMEIKDLLAYLRVVCNPNDSMSVRRIINVPSRGIGATTLDRLINFAAHEGIPLFEAIQRVDEITTINRGLQAKVRRFTKIFDDFDASMLPADALDYVLKITGYLKNLEAQNTIEAQNRVENIEELINAVIEYEQNVPEPTLSDYLENVALIADIDTMETDTTDMVTLMTLHSAKGLEFPFVFIVGMEEGYLPHGRSLDTQAELEEERRLCYVGITRAMEQLYLLHASSRRTFRETEYRIQSRFISEIPEHLIKHVDRYRSPFRQSESLYEVVSEDAVDYYVDQIVHHPQFGRGKITKISGAGQGVYVTVRFDRAGTKQLAASVTSLQTVSDE